MKTLHEIPAATPTGLEPNHVYTVRTISIETDEAYEGRNRTFRMRYELDGTTYELTTTVFWAESDVDYINSDIRRQGYWLSSWYGRTLMGEDE